MISASTAPKSVLTSSLSPPAPDGFPASHQSPQQQNSLPSPVPLRLCTNAWCNGVVRADSTHRRCMGCVVRDWKDRDDPERRKSNSPSVVSTALSVGKNKDRRKPKKRVSWFDGYQTDGDVSSQDQHSDKRGDHLRVCGDELSRKAEGTQEGAVEDSDTEMQDATQGSQRSGLIVRGWESGLTQFNGDEEAETSTTGALAVDQNAEAGPSSGHSSTRCAIKTCQEFLPLHYDWKCCPSCRKSSRKSRIKRMGRPMPHKRLRSDQSGSDFEKPQRDRIDLNAAFSKNQLGSYVLYDPAGLVTTGARICTNRGCRHIVPDIFEYRYKLCFPCRMRTARNARLRQAKGGREARLADGLPVENEDILLEETVPFYVQPPHELLRASLGRCAQLDCGMKLEPEKRQSLRARAKGSHNSTDPSLDFVSSICEQCTWRKLPVDARRNQPAEIHRRVRILSADRADLLPPAARVLSNPCIHSDSALTIKLPERPVPPPKPRVPGPYPEYQSLSRLIFDLQELFANYLQAQAFYCLALHQEKHAKSIPLSKFSFDGEFSAVALDYDVWSRRNEVEKYVTDVIREVERVAMVQFSSRSWAVAHGGIVTRIACRDMVPVALPRGIQADLTIPPTKEVMGELEVVVLPVDSHRCFCGQRTVVRLRLVG
ncbi:hypothetical protein GYMLUDRAFT_668989 [Collybiopsis luxurians FD-317 M1]|uniref:Uncharacterized protein n=1 Tax=Collybiopsis luxurians FD-317 M1 TaxID=944289 RepID=A0A0D0B7P4_9AGAR|nr:hypothetical protein GYMLUDRAFT_668989 [Collybiopsis luxurians FD-317 M1]